MNVKISIVLLAPTLGPVCTHEDILNKAGIVHDTRYALSSTQRQMQLSGPGAFTLAHHQFLEKEKSKIKRSAAAYAV